MSNSLPEYKYTKYVQYLQRPEEGEGSLELVLDGYELTCEC